MRRARIVDVETLRAACDVLHEDGREHWLWAGPVDRGRPMAWIDGGKVTGQRIVAVVLGRGEERRESERWFAACGIAACLSPFCLRLGSVRAMFAASSAGGRLKRRPDTRARMTSARLARPGTVPAELVRWAMDSEQSARDAAHGLGVSRGSVVQWRRGARRAAAEANPWAALLRLAA